MYRAVLVLVVAVPTAACAQPGGRSAAAPDAEVLGAWELVEGSADGVPLPLPPGSRATIVFEETQVDGVSFCNHYGAGYRQSGNSLVLDGLGGTDMGCAPEIMAAESAYLTALGSAGTVTLDDGGLLLTGEGVSLRFRPLPPVPTSDLAGTPWVLETLLDGELASSPVAGADAGVLRLDADGTFTGSTGCREISGTWTTHGDEVDFPELAAEGECPDDLAGQDGHVVTVLGDGFRVSIDGDRLTTTDPDGSGLVYRAAAS